MKLKIIEYNSYDNEIYFPRSILMTQSGKVLAEIVESTADAPEDMYFGRNLPSAFDFYKVSQELLNELEPGETLEFEQIEVNTWEELQDLLPEGYYY